MNSAHLILTLNASFNVPTWQEEEEIEKHTNEYSLRETLSADVEVTGILDVHMDIVHRLLLYDICLLTLWSLFPFE